MLSSALVREIEQLLQEGRLSQRQISLRLHVSRGSIAAVAQGAWKGFGRDEDEPPAQTIPAVRCRGCGGLVRPPCRLCAIRALKTAERVRRERVRRFLATCSRTPCAIAPCRASNACGRFEIGRVNDDMTNLPAQRSAPTT